MGTRQEVLDAIRTVDAATDTHGSGEPDPSCGGTRIRQGVAEDRRISVEDGEMRHGRKSKRVDGYKRYVAHALDAPLILACAVTPVNRPEAEAAPALDAYVRNQGCSIHSLHVDRGYMSSALVDDVLQSGRDAG